MYETYTYSRRPPLLHRDEGAKYRHRLRTSPDRGEQQGIASQCTAYLLAEAGKQDREQSA